MPNTVVGTVVEKKENTSPPLSSLISCTGTDNHSTGKVFNARREVERHKELRDFSNEIGHF